MFILSVFWMVSLSFLCGCLCFLSFVICDNRVLHESRWYCYKRVYSSSCWWSYII